MKRAFLSMTFFLMSIGNIYAQSSLQHSEVITISENYRNWVLGSSSIDYSNPLIQIRYKEIISTASKAVKKFDEDKDNDGIRDIFFNEKIVIPASRPQLDELFSKYLFPLSLAYHTKPSIENGLTNPFYGNKMIRQYILNIYKNLRDHGWKEGIDIGVLHMNDYPETGYIGYYSGMSLRCLSYAVSVFLNKELLEEEGKLAQELSTLGFISKEVGSSYDVPILWEQKGFNTDAIRSMFNVRLCYVLALPDNDPKRLKELQYFTKLLNKSLQIAEGWADLIKPDFLGFHHLGAYLNSYAPSAYNTASIFISVLDGTSFQVEQKAINNLSQAILHMRIYANKFDLPRSVAGRFPYKLNALTENIACFSNMSKIKSPYQSELKAAFFRLWQPDFKTFTDSYLKNVKCGINYTGSLGELELTTAIVKKGGQAEKNLNGFWYYPYGGLGIYRNDDWQISFSGTSKYIWDYESSRNGQNKYGRFSRAGVLRIMAGGNPITAEASGYSEKGWNWTRLPGATTVDMPFEEMKQKSYQESHRLFTPESFLGGVSIGSKAALVSMKYNAPFYKTPLNTLKANKSFFFFDDYIVAIGSNIEADSQNKYPVQTTLFQNGMKSLEEKITVGGHSISEAFSKVYKNQDVFLTDAQGHAYYVPNATNLIIEKTMQIAPTDNNELYKGPFSTARIMHGTMPINDSYLYYVKIRGGDKESKALKKNAKIFFEVKQQDSVAHIVSYSKENITAYALLQPNQTLNDELLDSTDTPCLAMIRDKGLDIIEIAVQNPELGKIDKMYDYSEINKKYKHAKSNVQSVVLSFKGIWEFQNSYSHTEIISKDNGITKVKFSCFDGQPIHINLKRK